MDKLFTLSVKTTIGRLYLAASEKGLVLITQPHIKKEEFLHQLKNRFPNSNIMKENTVLNKTAKQLEQYFLGELKSFTIPLDIQGTAFQKKVLDKVSQIAIGTTKTYGQIAKEINKPKAYRAVGTANATNRLPFVIPCHRVVASNGLGGYAGGLKLKEKLLLLESNKI